MQSPSELLTTVRVPSDEDAEALAPTPEFVFVVVWPFIVLDVVTCPFPAVTEVDAPAPALVVDPDTAPPPAVTELDMFPAFADELLFEF